MRQSTTATENARNAATTHSRPHKKRRGATCDARMTGATTRNAAKNADAAARRVAADVCPYGHGRHKWRPYDSRVGRVNHNAWLPDRPHENPGLFLASTPTFAYLCPTDSQVCPKNANVQPTKTEVRHRKNSQTDIFIHKKH